jgi:hypothetical protein
MELFKNARLRIGKRILDKKLAKAKRNVFYSNISQVKKIGIVWDASRPEDFAALSRFNLKMNERNIEVKILGYFPGKELPDQYTAIRYLTCLKKQELNFFYQPVSSESETFIKTRFDILIDINFRKLFPLQVITSLSNAGLKSGLFDSGSTEYPFDLMMEMKSPVDVDNYLGQIVQYLEIINSGSDKKEKPVIENEKI